MIVIKLTSDELSALRDIVEMWISEGFTTPPYEPAIQSVITKVREVSQ